MPVIYQSLFPIAPSGNGLAAALAQFAHYWAFEDGTTHEFEDATFTDSGVSASPIYLRGPNASNSWSTNLPGITRGSPWESSIWAPGAVALGNTTAATVNQIATATTGGWGMWIRPTGLSDATGPMGLFYSDWSSNQGLSMGVRVYGDGTVEAYVDSNTNQHYVYTGTGKVIDEAWNFVYVQQAADGTGLQIWVNGVDEAVTITNAGTGSNDYWVADMYSAWGTPTRFQIGSSLMPAVTLGGSVRGFDGHISSAFMLENETLTGSEIIALGTSAIGASLDASDVRNWILDNIDPYWYVNMSCATTNGDLAYWAASPLVIRESTAATPTVGPWTDTDINHFHNGAYSFGGSTSYTIFPTSGADGPLTHTAGTWGFWVRTPSVMTSQKQFNWYASGFTNTCNLGVNSSGKFFFNLTSNSTNTFTMTVTGHTPVASTWYFVCVTQDGSGVRFYIDGVEYTGGDLTTGSGGSGVDTTSWHNNFSVKTSANSWRISGYGGSSSTFAYGDGAVADFFYHDSALTSTQIANIQAATEGTFN